MGAIYRKTLIWAVTMLKRRVDYWKMDRMGLVLIYIFTKQIGRIIIITIYVYTNNLKDPS